jgi:malate dehydrogenase
MEKSFSKSLKRLNNIRNQLEAAVKNNSKEPVHVLVTGASGNIGYSLSFMISQGRMFGPNQPVILHLFDLPNNVGGLKGLSMELTDGAFKLLKGIVYSADPAIAFKDVDYAIMCGARPRTQGMERKDLLSVNAKIFEEQGKYFDTYAKKTVKVCVVGNPANTNALILAKNAPSINFKNFTALTRLDHNRAVGQLAEKLKIDNDKIKNVTIWGNHSTTQHPDIDYCVIEDDNNTFPVKSMIADDKWIQNEFIKTVQQRGAAIIAARKISSVASTATAICDHMRDWICGTSDGQWVSMGVMSKGEYGAPTDVVFSFPVTCKSGEWKIVENLKLSEFSKEKLAITGKELLEERTMALNK